MRIFITNEELAEKVASKDFEVITPSNDIQFTISQINSADVVVVGNKVDWNTMGIFWRAVYSDKPTIVIADDDGKSIWRNRFATKVVADIEEALPILYRWRAEGKFPK